MILHAATARRQTSRAFSVRSRRSAVPLVLLFCFLLLLRQAESRALGHWTLGVSVDPPGTHLKAAAVGRLHLSNRPLSARVDPPVELVHAAASFPGLEKDVLLERQLANMEQEYVNKQEL